MTDRNDTYHCIVDIGSNTQKTRGDFCHSNSSEIPPVNAGVKNWQEVK